MQEDFGKECGGADACFAHSQGVRLVDFWFEELGDEWEEDFGEDGDPLFVGWGGEVV